MGPQGRDFLDKGGMPFLRCADQQTIPRFIPVSHDQAQQAVDVRRVAAEHLFSEIGLVALEGLENPEQRVSDPGWHRMAE